MVKYEPHVNSPGFEGSGHILADKEVKTVISFKSEKGYISLDEIYSDLPEILEDYDDSEE